MPATINPGPRPVTRKAHGWSDYDLLTRRPQDERVAMGTAAVITVLLHGALLLVIPWHSAAPPRHTPPPPPPMEYSLEPLTPEEQQQMMQYMQANPNAPERTPVDTPNFSSRNQQAAQREPVPNATSDTPRTQGEVEDSPTILSGSPASPPPSPPPAPPPTPATAQSQPSPPAAQPPPPTPAEQQTQPTPPAQPASAPPPLPALQGLPGTGEGINLAEKPVESPTEKPPEKPADQPAENPTTPTAETQPSPEAAQTAPPAQPTPQTPPAQPSPNATPAPPVRQRVQVELPPGVVRKSAGDAGVLDNEAVNAKFREFGGYLDTMFEAIGSAWRLSVQKQTLSTQDYHSRVVVMFSINQKGEIVALRVMDSNSSQMATLLCTTAIQSRAPFGPWTKEMIAQLHEHEEIRITFWYR